MLTACGTPQLQIAEIDQATGKIISTTPISNAVVIAAKTISLKSYKGMLFVSDWGQPGTDETYMRTSVFIKQVMALNCFDRVLDSKGLAQVIATEGLSNKVENTHEPLSLNRLYHTYQPFLWVHFESGGSAIHPYAKIIVTNPSTLDNVFIGQTAFSGWVGITNEQGFYPLFNAFSVWLRQNW
ncbi:MAG: hypothetical protein AB1831_07220 [Pseudomonadota bacterium]